MASVLESLNTGLHRALQADPTVYLLGEDILDPYGGAFKVTRGLSDAYPDRVLASPVSEAGLTGLAAGMALRGLRPVVEVMFGDFITLAADQLINGAAKFRWMYHDQVKIPMVLRTPMGGRRGYGPTHSQTLEKLYLGVPGLEVLAPCPFGDPGEMLIETILGSENPTLFVENKLLYLLPVAGTGAVGEFDIRPWITDGTDTTARAAVNSPNFRLQLRGAPPPVVTIAAYGYTAELARQAVQALAFEHEIFAELIVPTRLAPVDAEAILQSAGQTGRLLVAEEGSLTLGWGAEILARALESPDYSLGRAGRVAARETPIPAAPALEEKALPGVDDIVQRALELTAS
ncbi:MAG: transketolase C-terminal domain-containing protein [Anaerolineales bacterium]|nr:transketolase C-terminal domain-containing protein [Anaerolineales bacterium]